MINGCVNALNDLKTWHDRYYVAIFLYHYHFSVYNRIEIIQGGLSMGKKSVKEDKNIYFLSRENADLTREEASEKTFISKSRIESIEYESSAPRPDEVIAMARAYNSASMCNYYCSHDCEIGQEYVPEIQTRHLTQAVLEMLSSMNNFDKHKEQLIDITADGKIDQTELHDLAIIQNGLARVSMAIDSFNLWVNNKISDCIIDKDDLELERNSLKSESE